MLKGQAKVFKHGKAETLYVAIPSSLARDSKCPIAYGDIVSVEIVGNKLEIRKK